MQDKVGESTRTATMENNSGKTFFMLVNDFLDYSPSGAGTVHLRVISDDSCRKFHTDGYPLRLFTTYLGRGTEWLPEKATNRKGLGKSNDLIVKKSFLNSANEAL